MDLAIGAKQTCVMMEHADQERREQDRRALQLSADRHRLRHPHLHRPRGDRRARRTACSADRDGRRPEPRRTAEADRRAVADRAAEPTTGDHDHDRPKPSSATPSARPSAATAARSSSVRADDLGAIPLKALMARNPSVDWAAVDRRASTAAPTRPARTTATSPAWRRCSPACRSSVPGATINRLCGSGMDAVGTAARAIKAGEAELMIAGGVESMSRAPFVMPQGRERVLRAATRSTTPPSAGASSTS